MADLMAQRGVPGAGEAAPAAPAAGPRPMTLADLQAQGRGVQINPVPTAGAEVLGPAPPLGGQPGQLALPQRGTGALVTPPPAAPEAAATARPMTPSEVAIELRTALEAMPRPEPARPIAGGAPVA